MGTPIVIPPLPFAFFAARQIIAGLTAGAVTGRRDGRITGSDTDAERMPGPPATLPR